MTFDVLKTGSSGNAVVINEEILVDCGVPFKVLEQSGYIKKLRLVLLTHRHSDHFKPSTVKRLHEEHPALRWGCCEWMVGPLLDSGVSKNVIDVFHFNRTYRYGDFQLSVEPTVHDVPNCCYHINAYGELIFYATDCATLDMIEAKNYSYYLIESNYDEAEIEERIAEKLENGEFAYEFRAAQNHLSREQALDWLARNAGPDSQYVLLHQHIERNNKNDQDH